MPLLETIALKKSFGGLEAVQGFDFSMAEGEIVGLIGPNGSGKTTIFNLITGMYPASGGSIRFGGHELLGLPPHTITLLGLARTFQNQRLFNQMTVLENVLVGRHCRTHAGLATAILGLPFGKAEKQRSIEHAMELLALFGDRLLPRAHDLANSLSYANRRRLEIARGLATAPRLLLLDEPAAGMNPTETRELTSDILRIHDTRRCHSVDRARSETRARSVSARGGARSWRDAHRRRFRLGPQSSESDRSLPGPPRRACSSLTRSSPTTDRSRR